MSYWVTAAKGFIIWACSWDGIGVPQRNQKFNPGLLPQCLTCTCKKDLNCEYLKKVVDRVWGDPNVSRHHLIYTERMPKLSCLICTEEFKWRNRGEDWSFCNSCFKLVCVNCCVKIKKQVCSFCRTGTFTGLREGNPLTFVFFFNPSGAIKEDHYPEMTDDTALLKSMEFDELKVLYPEEFILDFLQLPDDAVEQLKDVANLHGVKWINYLNELFRELKPNSSCLFFS
jgi:hypothetical protein